tara:strand:- start:989 stop:1132 length:144 start_codon:yes stop_codon:yes gene_type:complete
VLIQKNQQQTALVNKLNKEVGVSEDQMKSLMNPFSNNNGAMQFGNSG